MAAEKVNIASLSIDFNDVIKKSAAYKKQIDEMKKAQKELDQTTEQGRLAYSKNAAELKNLSKAYRDNQSFASALDAANKDLTKTMSTQDKSTQELRDSRSQLNQISKNIVGNTEEEIALREQLNEAIDNQTEALREQSSEFNSSKDKIGEYENGFKSAFAQLNIMNGGIGGFVQRSSEAGGTGKLFTSSLKGMANGMLGMTKASLAFIATPIGAILAVLVGAFALVKNAMNRSETATNKIKKAFSAFSGIINGLLKILEPLGEFLIDGLVKGFELVEKGIFKALDAIAKGLDFLGFDEQAASLRGFTEEIQESVEASKRLAEAEIALEKAQRIATKTQLDFQKQAEKLRQIRDDESKTISERIRANEELGKVLKQQLAAELEIANQALEVAKLRIIAEGETKETLDAQAEALTTISDIQERITGQESEQLSNLNSLRRDAAAKQKEIIEKAIEKQKEQLDLFIAQQGIRAKTLEEQIALEEQISEKSIAILDAELKAKKISQEKYDAEILTIQNDLLAKRAELAVDNAQRELQDYVQNNQSKLDSEKFLSEQLFEEERARFERLAEQRREFEAKRLEEGVINQTEYNAAINAIDEENRILNEELAAERKEAKAEQDIADFENKLALDAEHAEINLAQALSYLEREKEAELKIAEATGANKTLIEDKYAKAEVDIKRQVSKNKVDLASDTLGNLVTILGKESAAGKAVAVAQATIDTYSSAVSAFNSLSGIPIVGPVLGGIAAAAAVASGIATVSKIVSTPKPQVPTATFARGGLLQGASHSQGGIQTRFGELEGGEAVINKRSTSMFAPLLSSINQAGGGRKFANGGILGQSAQPESLFDYEMFAEKTSQAVASLPNPIVGVDEISSVSNKVDVIEQNASL